MVITHIQGHGIQGDGFIIGRGMGRGIVGKSGTKESIGGSKTQIIIQRGE